MPRIKTPLPSHLERDRSRILASARKARQRTKAAAAGMVRLEIMIPESVVNHLKTAASLSGNGSVKEQAEWLLRKTAEANAKKLEEVLTAGAAAWKRAMPFLPYSQYLTKPGAVFRVGVKTLQADDWLRVSTELGQIFATLQQSRGWSKRRTQAALEARVKALA